MTIHINEFIDFSTREIITKLYHEDGSILGKFVALERTGIPEYAFVWDELLSSHRERVEHLKKINYRNLNEDDAN